MMWRLGILGDWCVLLIPVVKMKCLIMELTKFRDYMHCLQRATVELSEKGGVVSFNGFRLPGDYALEITELEMRAWPKLMALFRYSNKHPKINLLLQAYVSEMDVVMNISHTEELPHLYLLVNKHGQSVDWNRMKEKEKEDIYRFLSIQHSSYLRLRSLITGRKQALGQYRLREGAPLSGWLELGNALFSTGEVVSLGGDRSKKAFLVYWFECFGAELPVNYGRQVGQIQERANITIFLDHLKEEYQNYLSERYLVQIEKGQKKGK